MTTPVTDILVAIESYNESHLIASSNLKSSVWDLYKARRQRGRNAITLASAFSASDIREELRAQTTLTYKIDVNEPELINESNVKEESTDKFRLNVRKDCVQGEKIISENATQNKIGMRQRRKGDIDCNKGSENNSWTEESYYQEQESKLLKTDPLELFGGGLAPRELKSAQKHAKESLIHYIAAANRAAEILEMTNQLSQLHAGSDKD